MDNGTSRGISRREFLKKGCRFLAALGLSSGVLGSLARRAWATVAAPVFREAMFYERLDGKTVKCGVCFRNCVIRDGQRGFCRNKENRGGILYNIVHSRPSAVQIDPVEKEPSYHLLPGTEILCFGTAGCNFRCKFCHNWHLSQRSIEGIGHAREIAPETAVDIARQRTIPTISFTYNDPISFYEYVYDVAELAKRKGFRILIHTNGTMNPEPLKRLLEYTDGVTVDLKGFTESFYRDLSQASLAPALRSLESIKKSGRWLEIVNLVIPTKNDDPGDMKKMCEWIRDHLGTAVPIHFTRFSPAYKLTSLPYTPIETLEDAYAIAKGAGLEYIYLGNVPGHLRNSTFCPRCEKRLIHRVHFQVLENTMKDGRCMFCEHPIPGIWS